MTLVTVIDRDWVIKSLDANAKAKRANIKWMRDICNSSKDGHIGADKLPPLPATVSEELKMLVQINGNVEKPVNWLDELKVQINKGRHPSEELATNVAVVAPERIRSNDGTIQDGIGIRFNFSNYSPNCVGSIYGSDLNTIKPSSEAGNNAVLHTPFYGLVIDLNSLLLQEYFPPDSGKVKAVEATNQTFQNYEWITKDGWFVRTLEDNAIIATSKKKRL